MKEKFIDAANTGTQIPNYTRPPASAILKCYPDKNRKPKPIVVIVNDRNIIDAYPLALEELNSNDVKKYLLSPNSEISSTSYNKDTETITLTFNSIGCCYNGGPDISLGIDNEKTRHLVNIEIANIKLCLANVLKKEVPFKTKKELGKELSFNLKTKLWVVILPTRYGECAIGNMAITPLFEDHFYNQDTDTAYLYNGSTVYCAVEIKHVSEPVSLLFLLDSKNTLVGIAVKGASHVIKQKVD
ncbi:MAG: hypothetical protein HY515_04925 [Candidatus Aenigmarchaeota archaeon]|nr:hypothetical protein [Candidatus Aenigmarchaeota archaeon]